MDSFFKSTSKHKFIKNYIKSTLSWDKVIYNIDLNVQEKEKYCIKTLTDFGIVIHKIFDVNEVDLILEKIKKNNLKHKSFSAHMYISLSNKSKTFGKHKDTSDVWFWQCIGKTKWDVFESNTKYSYVLESGDFIYIPKNVFHETTPLEPRVGISFGLDYPSENIIYS